jgi:hypothetical protein
MKASAPWDVPWALPRPDNALTRTVMEDSSSSDPSSMILRDFASKLHDDEFEFILFDACMMGGVEVVYELRDKTRWIVASPAEDLADGFPYKKIVADLMAPVLRLGDVSRKFYEYYNYQSGQARTATIGLYNCSQIGALADVMREIAIRYGSDIKEMPTSGIQHFDREEATGQPYRVMFDVVDFVENIPDVDPLDVQRVRDAVNRVVVYKAATQYILSEIKIDNYCGISCYIPNEKTPRRNEYYTDNTAWGAYVFDQWQ